MPDSYDSLISITVFLILYFGADYLYSRFKGGKSLAIEQGLTNTINVAGDYINLPPETIRQAAQRVKLLREHIRQEKEILRNELNARAAQRKAEYDFYKKNARESDRFFDNLHENMETMRQNRCPE